MKMVVSDRIPFKKEKWGLAFCFEDNLVYINEMTTSFVNKPRGSCWLLVILIMCLANYRLEHSLKSHSKDFILQDEACLPFRLQRIPGNLHNYRKMDDSKPTMYEGKASFQFMK